MWVLFLVQLWRNLVGYATSWRWLVRHQRTITCCSCPGNSNLGEICFWFEKAKVWAPIAPRRIVWQFSQLYWWYWPTELVVRRVFFSLYFISNTICQNYWKEWVNIELPVLSVHGNHDNPVGEYSASAIDLLTTLGLISHFGRIHDANKWVVFSLVLLILDSIEIRPITLKKGKTIVNLYGFGSIKDERLNALIQVGL